jgi:hypothetical protein
MSQAPRKKMSDAHLSYPDISFIQKSSTFSPNAQIFHINIIFHVSENAIELSHTPQPQSKAAAASQTSPSLSSQRNRIHCEYNGKIKLQICIK